MRVMERIKPRGRIAGPEKIQLPAGYRIEPVVADLNYPTAVSWDADGYLLIAESRFPYGQSAQTELRIVRQGSDGTLETAATGFDGLINDITVYQGLLYVSHRGKISVAQDGHLRDLISGLPSWGMHQNNTIVFDRQGRLYFSQGTATNSGVLGDLDVRMLQETGHLDAHDFPGAEVVLTGKNYDIANPLTGEMRSVGAFSPWGVSTTKGQHIPGAKPGQAASGAIMRANRDGSDLRVYAWGLRNPFGLLVGADDRLYATNNGANLLPPRPVANDPDTLWLIEEGAWYGWPDFYAGKPITDPAFKPEGAPPHEFLIANHDQLLKGRSTPAEPLLSLGMNVGASGFDICLHQEFGFPNQLFIAEFGPMVSAIAGAPPDLPGGRQVVRVDLATRMVSEFAANQGGLPPSRNGNSGGLERPVAAKFGPDGCLYIVDYGVMDWQDGGGWAATEGTGVIWKVTHVG